MSKRSILLALPVAAAMALSACGGAAADRPSAEELSDVFTSGEGPFEGAEIPQETADCIAEVMVDSDLSDEALRALADGDEDYEGDEDEEAALTEAVTTASTECIAVP